MAIQRSSTAVPPSTASWVSRHLEPGERIIGADALHGGISSAEMRRLIIVSRSGATRCLVLRSYIGVEHATELLDQETIALTALRGSDVRAPELLAVDATAAHCASPSLLMTHLPGRTIFDGQALPERADLLAHQLVRIHALEPLIRPPAFVALTTAETVVVPEAADPAAWATAIDLIRGPVPRFEGCFLHRDFQPGNVLFDMPSAVSVGPRIAGVVDWAQASWGPTDLDVAHCCTNLALLHGPEWGLRFARLYERAGGVLSADPGARLFWRIRDAMACSEEVAAVTVPWREAGRTELTVRAAEHRLDAYVMAVLDALG